MQPRGYADADAEHRYRKARKIEHLLGGVDGAELLDLGSGSGLLAEYFASRGARVRCADRDGPPAGFVLPFSRIEGERLPFADGQFEIVVFNHVIEHVGDRARQRTILREIDCILKPGGRLYLAVPSKWALVEPHFRLPLLGAKPRGLADRLVRRFRGFPRYDCHPLGLAGFHAPLPSASRRSSTNRRRHSTGWRETNWAAGPAGSPGQCPGRWFGVAAPPSPPILQSAARRPPTRETPNVQDPPPRRSRDRPADRAGRSRDHPRNA